MLEGSSSKGIADLSSIIDEPVLPCQFIEWSRHADSRELTAARRESDLKISGKEVYFGILQRLQKVLGKRARTASGEQGDHYAYLSYEVDRAIDQLPPKCREIFVLSRYEQLTYKEIADKLGLSVKTVEAQMGIALKRLRDTFSTATFGLLMWMIHG